MAFRQAFFLAACSAIAWRVLVGISGVGCSSFSRWFCGIADLLAICPPAAIEQKTAGSKSKVGQIKVKCHKGQGQRSKTTGTTTI